MKTIHKAHNLFVSILGKQQIKETKYRPLKFVRKKVMDDNLVIYNVMTQEIVVLNCDEASDFLEPIINKEVTKKLIEKWFLVPVDFDDRKFIESFDQTVDLLKDTENIGKIRSATILTTTDCNARCFYCYEKGCAVKTMSSQTAEDVATYLAKNYAGNELALGWFGGEPLFNMNAINIITARLKEKGIKFHSKMTTNGYLFDPNVIANAKNLWNLISAQITIDGTEWVYNRIKNYIYDDIDSPFVRVMDNIENLLKNGITVKVRMNIDMHNYEDLFDLVEYLLERFSKYSGFYVYPHPLYDYKNEKGEFVQSDQHKQFIDDKCKQLNDIIFARNLKIKKSIVFKRDLYHCTADNDHAVIIMPDGKLGKCEHYLDNHFIGSIYSKNINVKELKWFKKMFYTSKECYECEFRPACRMLVCCPDMDKECDDYYKNKMIESAESALEKIYMLYKDVPEEKIKW